MESVKTINGLEVKWTSNIEDIESMRNQWEELFSITYQSLPYLSYPWTIAFIRYLLSKDEVAICIFVFDNDNLVGLLPLKLITIKYMGISEIKSLRDSHTRSADLLYAPGKGEVVLRSVYEIFPLINKRIYKMSLLGISEASETINAVPKALQENRYKISHDGIGSYFDLSIDYTSIMDKLSNNFKANLRKARNKLLNCGKIDYEYISGGKFTNKELMWFLDIEASGWKGEKGTAIKMNKMLLKFYSEVFQNFSARGIAEGHFLSVDGKKIAAHLAVRLESSLVLLKIAYDERYSHCSPGNMLFLNMMEREISNCDIKEINCLTDMAWHNNWKMKRRNYYNISVYHQGNISYLYGIYDKEVKNAVKNMLVNH